MKKLLFVVLLFVGGISWADNSKRIDELSQEGNTLLQKKQELVATIQKIDVRVIQIQAVIEELKKQDEPKEKDFGDNSKRRN
jgi:predicted  nucleic acid-binding Zn-ribbon protein